MRDNLPPNPSVKRMLTVGAFDINSGIFKRFDESLPFDKMLNASRASGAFPVYFAPNEVFPNLTLVDGGLYQNLDADGAIQKCINAGYA
jgi:predicted acylesterase/phospholipase RssA